MCCVWVAMPILTNLLPLDINPDFNAARCTQPKRKRFVIGNHAHKKEGRVLITMRPQKGTATGDGFGDVAGWPTDINGPARIQL